MDKMYCDENRPSMDELIKMKKVLFAELQTLLEKEDYET